MFCETESGIVKLNKEKQKKTYTLVYKINEWAG